MKKFIIFIFFVSIIFSSCEKNDLEVPPGYKMLIGKWHVYSFRVAHNIGSPYYYSETFDSTQLPYQLKVYLEEDRWEVIFDNTFVCGEKIDGFEFADNAYSEGYLLDGSGERVFNISYKSSDSTLYLFRGVYDNMTLGGDIFYYYFKRDY